MMEASQRCLECGAVWVDGHTCAVYFHQMLFWEAENPHYGVEVHHLMVLCYHLQHPSLYSPDGVNEARGLLVEFIEHDASPVEVVRRNRARVDSSRRDWKITGTAASYGSYDAPIHWEMTAVDVVAGGSEHYCDNVRSWAGSINATLKYERGIRT